MPLTPLFLISFQTVNLAPEHRPLEWRALPDCKAEAADEIVVCAKEQPDQRYRVHPPEGLPEARLLPEARTRIPGLGSVDAHGAHGRFGEAQAKITLTIPF